jgi:hypothetical protein
MTRPSISKSVKPMTEPHPPRKLLQEAHEHTRSAADIIHELLSSREEPDPVRLELAADALKQALSRLNPPRL